MRADFSSAPRMRTERGSGSIPRNGTEVQLPGAVSGLNSSRGAGGLEFARVCCCCCFLPVRVIIILSMSDSAQPSCIGRQSHALTLICTPW